MKTAPIAFCCGCLSSVPPKSSGVRSTVSGQETPRLQQAKFLQTAAVKDMDYRHPQALNKSLMMALAGCAWIGEHRNCLITGPTGAGKSYLACALGQKACREGFSVLYFRLPRLAMDRGNGRYLKLPAGFAKTDLLILDDWGTSRPR